MLWLRAREGLGVNRPRLVQEARALMAVYGYADWGLTVCATTDRLLRHLNRAHRGMDAPTDVLSFPFYSRVARPGVIERQPHARLNDLGHLFISVPYLDRFCAREEEDRDDRFRLLLSHGIAHLLGHDHQEEGMRLRMEAVEEFALDAASGLVDEELRRQPLVDDAALRAAERELRGTAHWQDG